MPESKRKWSFRRWRRRWRERFAAASLRARIWFHRHVLSQERRRDWRRRWRRRTEKWGRGIEGVGFKVMPHRPDAAPDNWRRRLGKRWDHFVDGLYAPEARVRHATALRSVWRENTTPIRQANERVLRWIDAYLIGSFTPATFRKRFWNWRGLVGALAMAGLLAGFIFWAIPQWRVHQQQKWASQARLLLGRGYFPLAYQNAIRVLRLNDEHEDASRVLADLLERQGSAEALNWRRKVVEASATVSNRLALAASAVRFEQPPSPTAMRVLEEVAGTASNTLHYRAVAAQFELRNGNFTAAEAHYLAGLAAEPANIEVELALATLRLQGRDPLRLELAEDALESLSTRTNIGIRALRPLVIVQAARGQYAVAKEYSARVLAAENSTFEDRLVHLRVLTESRDPQRDPFLRTLQDQVSANALYAAQLATWMAGNNLARPAREWLAGLPPTVRTAEPVRLTTVSLYATLNDWDGMEQELLRQRWGTIEFARLAWLARAYRGQGDRRAADEHLRRSTELASGMSLRLAALFRLVMTWGWEREGEEILWTVFERYPNENWAPDLLQRRYFERGHTRGLERVFALQFKRSPKDVPLKNNLAMLQLLLKDDLPTAHRLAAEVHDHSPNSAVYASTYAFSLHRQGRSAEGRAVLEALGSETLKVPSIAAYYAVLTHATGDTNTARQHAQWARSARLLPEEEALLEAIGEGR
jgi:tetratricopeptide (TPR) repeat protein